MFKEIVNRYEGAVAATVIGMLGNCPEAQDVGQETFIRFYKSMQNFRGESTVKTFLTRIAINLSLNELKRRKRKNNVSSLDDPEMINQLTADDSEPGQRIHREILEDAIQHLTAKYRTLLVLRMIDGYSTEETARILNLAQGTVLSRLSRAKIKLYEILEPYKELI